MYKRFAPIVAACFSLLGCGAGKATDAHPIQQQDPPALDSVNHIVFMMQENEVFDHYFGQLNNYRQSLGLSPDADVTPQNATQLAYDHSVSFTPFHMVSMCTEDLSSFWNESHNDWNHASPTSGVSLMDGFANSAGNNSRHSPTGFDIDGKRVMGYYDETDLPYYYFMATQFAISDRWFSAVMSNTPSNRMYAVAATSHGVINKPLVQANVATIFDELDSAGITWKNYVQDYPKGSSLRPFPVYAKSVGTKIAPMADYFTDLANGTLPQVAFIERDAREGLDEHPGAGNSVQKGAAYVATIINALMTSGAWKDSIFFLIYDEGRVLRPRFPGANGFTRRNSPNLGPQRYLRREGRSDLRFRLYRLSHPQSRGLTLRKAALRRSHTHRQHGNSSIYRTTLRTALPHKTRCRPAGHQLFL